MEVEPPLYDLPRLNVASVNRRISSFGTTTSTEPCCVFEFGNLTLRAGVSGETTPRCVLQLRPSVSGSHDDQDSDNAQTSHQKALMLSKEWLGELEDRIEKRLREAINRYLHIGLRGKRVVVLENHLMPTSIKQSIARVIFTYHQPREITFLHAGICCALALSTPSAMVLDLGTRECTTLPIYDYRPLAALAQATRTAGTALLSRAQYLLQEHSEPPVASLTREDVLDFISRATVCLPAAPATSVDRILNTDLAHHYSKDRYRDGTFTWRQPSTGRQIIVPQWIRIAIPEILFEARNIYSDPAYRSIQGCIVDALKAAPVDVRPALQSLVVTGSLCRIPGLRSRIQSETGLKVIENIYDADLAWTGASLATSLNISGQSLTMQHFNSTSRVPDWLLPF